MDRDIMGIMAKASILLYAAQPAMQELSKRFIYDWTKILEKAVTASCSAEGIPMAHILLSSRGLAVRCRMSTLYAEPGRESSSITSAAERPCAITVAAAAPAMPMARFFTKIMSSTVFVKAEKIRKYRGRVESPTALSMPAPIL